MPAKIKTTEEQEKTKRMEELTNFLLHIENHRLKIQEIRNFKFKISGVKGSQHHLLFLLELTENMGWIPFNKN